MGTGIWRGFRLVIAVALLFVSFAVSFNAPAQTKAATNAAPSNRFLFVLDTSTGMKKYAADVDKIVEEIIHNSASGQMHKGDTLGFWTFNTNLFTGLYPLQTWLPENSDEIALMTKEFLRQQKFVKGSRFDVAMSGVMEVVKRSDIITVFVISTGEGRFQGTPFDDGLNALQQQVLVDNKGSHLPVVTVLQGKGGKLFRYTANMLPWPVVIPEVPIAIRMPAATPDTTAPQVAETKPVQKPPPANVNTPTTVAPATVTPATNTITQANVTPPAANPPPPVNTPPVTMPTPNPPQMAVPPVTKPQADRANMVPRPITAPTTAAPGTLPSGPDAIAANEPPPNMNPPIRQAPTAAAATANQPAATPPTQPKTDSPVVAAKTNSAPTRAAKGTNAPAAKTQQAAAMPGLLQGKSKYYLFAGVGMLVLAGILLVRMLVRGRSYRPSLISSSMGGPPKR